MTRREFFKSDKMRKIRGNIMACAALGYAVAIVSLIINVVMSHEYAVIFDALFIITMSLLVHLLQSRVAAILITIYAVIDVAVLYIMTGKPGGLIVLVIGIYAVVCTFKFHKAWNDHKAIEAAKDKAETMPKAQE